MNTWFFRIQALMLLLVLALIPLSVRSSEMAFLHFDVGIYDVVAINIAVAVVLLTLIDVFLIPGGYLAACAWGAAIACITGVQAEGALASSLWILFAIAFIVSAVASLFMVQNEQLTTLKEFERWSFGFLPTFVAIVLMRQSVIDHAKGDWTFCIYAVAIASVVWAVWGLDLDRRLHIAQLKQNQGLV